jgi:hypothetical protein
MVSPYRYLYNHQHHPSQALRASSEILRIPTHHIETIAIIQVVEIRDMVNMIIEDPEEDAVITMKIARATEGVIEAVAASEVGVEGAMKIVTISEIEKVIGARRRDQGTVGLEVLRVDMAGAYDGT